MSRPSISSTGYRFPHADSSPVGQFVFEASDVLMGRVQSIFREFQSSSELWKPAAQAKSKFGEPIEVFRRKFGSPSDVEWEKSNLKYCDSNNGEFFITKTVMNEVENTEFWKAMNPLFYAQWNRSTSHAEFYHTFETRPLLTLSYFVSPSEMGGLVSSREFVGLMDFKTIRKMKNQKLEKLERYCVAASLPDSFAESNKIPTNSSIVRGHLLSGHITVFEPESRRLTYYWVNQFSLGGFLTSNSVIRSSLKEKNVNNAMDTCDRVQKLREGKIPAEELPERMNLENQFTEENEN